MDALDGRTPDQLAAQRVTKRHGLTRGEPEGRAGPQDITAAHITAERAEEARNQTAEACQPLNHWTPVGFECRANDQPNPQEQRFPHSPKSEKQTGMVYIVEPCSTTSAPR